MTKFYGMKTSTSNLKEYLPDQYYNITHETIAEMLANEGYINNVHTIQISTCHRFVSICFDTRDTLITLLLPNIPITFQPDHYEKKRISIENLPIELSDKEDKTFLSEYVTLIGKTYYPGTKYQSKYYSTGTRVQQYINLTEHIPKHINYFGRYLRICYDEQPKDNPNITFTTNNPEDTPDPPSDLYHTTHSQQETAQTLSKGQTITDATPTQQLPDTPHTTPKNIPDDTSTPQLPDTPHTTHKNIPDDTPIPQLPDTPNITPEIHQQDEPEPHIQPKTYHEQIY